MVTALGVITDAGLEWLDIPESVKFSLTQGHPIVNGLESAYKAYSSTISLPLTRENKRLFSYSFLRGFDGKRFQKGVLIYSNTFVYCSITLKSFTRDAIKVKLMSTVFPQFDNFSDDEYSFPKKAKALGKVELLNLSNEQAPGSNTFWFRFDARHGDPAGYALPSIGIDILINLCFDWYGVVVSVPPNFFPSQTRVVAPGWLYGIDAEEGANGVTQDEYNCWQSMPDVSPFSLLKAIVLALGGYMEVTPNGINIRNLSDIVATNNAKDVSAHFIEAKTMEFSVLKYRKNNVDYKGEETPALSIYVDDMSLEREGTWFTIPITFTGDNNVLFTEDLKPKSGIMTLPFLNITNKKAILDSLAGSLSNPSVYEIVFRPCVDSKYLVLDGSPLLIRQLNEVVIPTEMIRTSEDLMSIKCIRASRGIVQPYIQISPQDSTTSYIAKVVAMQVASTSPWTIISTHSWCVPFPNTGTGDDVININVLQALYGGQRMTVLTGTNTQGATTTAFLRQNPRDESATLAYTREDEAFSTLRKGIPKMFTIPITIGSSTAWQTGSIDGTRNNMTLPAWSPAPKKRVTSVAPTFTGGVYVTYGTEDVTNFTATLLAIISDTPLPGGYIDYENWKDFIVMERVIKVSAWVYGSVWQIQPEAADFAWTEDLPAGKSYYLSYGVLCEVDIPDTFERTLFVRSGLVMTNNFTLTSI